MPSIVNLILLVSLCPWKTNGKWLADGKISESVGAIKGSHSASLLSKNGTHREHEESIINSDDHISSGRIMFVTCQCQCAHTTCGTCIPDLNSMGGTIQSKWYPRNYDPNLNCLYTLTVNRKGCVLQLTFIDFIVEEKLDFVTVDPPNKVFTGYDLPELIETKETKMTVQFTSNKNNFQIPKKLGRWKARYNLDCSLLPKPTETTTRKTTAKPRKTTTKPKWTTTKPRKTTTKPRWTTTKPRWTTSEPRTTLTEPENPTTEPGKTTNEPEIQTFEPERSTNEPEIQTTEPENSTTEQERSTTESEKLTTKPEKSTTEPEKSTTEPEKSTTEVEIPSDFVTDKIPEVA